MKECSVSAKAEDSGSIGGRQVLRGFIVLEGLDGAGTTTQQKLLESRLLAENTPHWICAEPTELPSGHLVRQVLRGEVEARPETLARLFAADRNEHLYGRNGIVERVSRGELVVCDRYIFSSYAYQGVSCGPELPEALNSGFPLPELLIFFDIPTEISLRRLDSRESREIFENAPFQQKVATLYRQIVDRYEAQGLKVLRIDAARPIGEVSACIAEAVGCAAERLKSAFHTEETAEEG